MKVLARGRLQSPRTKMRRIDRAFERVMQVLLIVFFVFTLTSMLANRAVFQINSVSVVGVGAASKENITRMANEFLSQKLLWRINRNNALFYPRRDLVRAIYESDAQIEHVDFAAPGWKALSVLITEFQPSLLWCTSNALNEVGTSSESCYLADKTGYIYALAPAYSGYPFVVFRTGIAGSDEAGTPIGLHILSKEEFARIGEFRELLGREGVVVREVVHTEEQDYNFATDEGWSVLWSTRRDASESIQNLLAALTEMQNSVRAKNATTSTSVIDLRFANKIFYR